MPLPAKGTLPQGCVNRGGGAILHIGPEGTLAGAVVILRETLSPLPKHQAPSTRHQNNEGTDSNTEQVTPAQRLTIDRCGIHPHQSVIARGATVHVRNNYEQRFQLVLVQDKVVMRAANLAPGEIATWQLGRSGRYQLGGLVGEHWHVANVIVNDSPHMAITVDDGRFAFVGMAPGKMGLSVHHQVLGEIHRVVELRGGEEQVVEIRY